MLNLFCFSFVKNLNFKLTNFYFKLPLVKIPRAAVPRIAPRFTAFTLAEVLITLVIIGIVSVLVIPSVTSKIQGYTNKRAHMVFHRKLETALQFMQGSNSIAGYHTTEDFVEQFKKYIKIAKICDSQHLIECFPSAIIDTDGTPIITQNSIKYASLNDLPLRALDTNVMGLILQDGTNLLLAYNTNCTPPENNSTTPNLSCFSIIYDTNGGSPPNRISLAGSNFTVSLGSKEDNSNLSSIKDVGTINASNYGKPVKIYVTSSQCTSFGGTISDSKCFVWRNNISWNAITNNACPTTNCSLTYSQARSWCESAFAPGMSLLPYSTLLPIVQNLYANNSIPVPRNAEINFASSDTAVEQANFVYIVWVYYGDTSRIIQGMNYKNNVNPGLYMFCAGDIRD